MSEDQIDRMESRLYAVEGGVVDLQAGQNRIEGKVDALSTTVVELGHQMRVLHEDTIARIADLAPDFRPIRREFQDADARLREDIERRIQPLEAAERRRRKK